MPIKPPFEIMKLLREAFVEELTTKSGPVAPVVLMERSPHGVVEAIPTFPPAVAR
jgi:hypothetical protein